LILRGTHLSLWNTYWSSEYPDTSKW